jgi:Protein of unknown function (DUF2523)
MYGIVLSALYSLFTFLLRSVLVKFVLFFALFFVASEFIQFITSCGCIPGSSLIATALGNMPSSVWYFLTLFGFAQGLTAVFSALAVRFLIRRIPFFG